MSISTDLFTISQFLPPLYSLLNVWQCSNGCVYNVVIVIRCVLIVSIAAVAGPLMSGVPALTFLV